MNIDILGISELKWTEVDELNSEDHYIYYCGQKSLTRNGVALTVKKRAPIKTPCAKLSVLEKICLRYHQRGKSFQDGLT